MEKVHITFNIVVLQCVMARHERFVYRYNMQWLVSILKLVLNASVQYFGLPLPNVWLTKTSFKFEEFSIH